MQWSDVVAPPPPRMLRQFAGLCIVFFGGIALWRAYQGHASTWTWAIGGIGAAIGLVGVIAPSAIRWFYSAWMIAVFPIGWAVSRLIIGVLFFLVFTPVAAVMRLIGRDALALRRSTQASYWTPKPKPGAAEDYFRQY